MTFTSRRKRRSFAAATTAAAAALPLLIAIPGTAHADEAATCAPNGKTYVVNSVGSLLQYTMATPLTGSTFSGYSQVGAGWGAYGKVLAGPKGEFYAFKSDGTYYAHRTDSGTWDINPKRISTALGWLGNAADREQATVDRDGWLWVADNLGQLYAYRYDPTIGTSGGLKSLKILDKGWNRYNLITAGDKGVLYGRAADGRLYRSRYDVTSQRWIERHVLVGSAAWGNFKTITAGGGDTLVTVRTSGEALYYRYDENTRTWPVVAKQVAAGGWQNFPNVTSRPDNCGLVAQHTPAAPSVPIEDFSRASALQSSAGTVEFAYARHDGTVRHGRMANPNKIDEVQWSSISEISEAFTGEPSLAEQSDGRVTVTAHSIIGGVWMLNQTARSSPEWANWSDQAGAMAQHAVTAKTPAGLLVQFAVDAGGKPWYRIQTAVNADFMGWMPLAGPKLTGLTPKFVRDGIRLFGRNTDGTLSTALFQDDGTLSDWTSLGDQTVTGPPAVIAYPGSGIRVIATGPEGNVVTTAQSPEGGAFGAWAEVDTVAAAGPPSAVLSPAGTIQILVRGTDGRIHHSGETALKSGLWHSWKPVGSEISATDPTAFTYLDNSGPKWAHFLRTADERVHIGTIEPPADVTARSLPVPPVK
ncbi:tachylectin-related carbohydrate-binding protein [Streptomyces sp. NPDC096193]|uniref:tachylectin-related carbohydrate-binding protein n=1 Tax=Streptomyces sp. NPDC096193 TaxID=3155821 RepID=UPI00332FA649